MKVRSFCFSEPAFSLGNSTWDVKKIYHLSPVMDASAVINEPTQLDFKDPPMLPPSVRLIPLKPFADISGFAMPNDSETNNSFVPEDADGSLRSSDSD
ncbi:hypothetical protein AAVH_33835 [Aphelenchoides avenae]|nr:hypothetical protein AAVH_33835 [Aphelenchus avenae]